MGFRLPANFPSLFSLIILFTLFTSSLFSPQLVVFQVLATSPAGGAKRRNASSCFFFNFLYSSLSIWLVCSCFSLIVSFHFYISYHVYAVPVISSRMTWDSLLWRSFVTAELVSRLRLKIGTDTGCARCPRIERNVTSRGEVEAVQAFLNLKMLAES